MREIVGDSSNPVGGFEEIGLKVRRVQVAVEQVRATATTGRGAVTVEVAVDGRIEALQLAHHGLDLGPERLAALIMEAQREASRDADSMAQELRRELTEDPRVARVVELVQSTPRVDEPAIATTPARQPAEEDEDNYFRSSFMEDPFGRGRR